MSGQPERSSSAPHTFRTADEIVRSILDDQAPSSSAISPSGELYRAIERFHANAHRRPGLVNSARRDLVRSHLNRLASTSRSSPWASMPPEPNSGSETHSTPSREPLASSASPSAPPSLPPLRSVNTIRRGAAMPTASSSNIAGRHGRTRASASERHAERNRNRSLAPIHSDPRFQRQFMLLEQANARRRAAAAAEQYGVPSRVYQPPSNAQQETEDTEDQIRTQLDSTHSHTPTQPYSELSFPSPPLQSQEHVDESRRSFKRRKLDNDRVSGDCPGFRYGRYGQVEPGALTMEMVSCDGGIYSKERLAGAAENILKNDASVYCTKGPRCNIVLRHQGATIFTLKELVIKAPRNNYTFPVQEGMVFISMSSDEALARTAKYQIQYLPPRSSTRRDTQPPWPAPYSRHADDGSGMTRSQVRARRLYNIGLEDDDNDYRVAQIPSEFTESPRQLQVTTVCSDDECEETTSPSDWRAPNRIGPLPFEGDSSDEDGDDTNVEDFGLGGTTYRSRRRQPPRLAATAEATQPTSQDTTRAGGGEMLAPHARFFIEPDKSKCTIRFEPPVSGRFILLKMWNPQRDPSANIDIQAVVAKGFAGPRYFPAVDLR